MPRRLHRRNERCSLNRRKWLLGMGAVPVCAWAGAVRLRRRIAISPWIGGRLYPEMQEANGAFNDPKARESARNGYAMTALGLLSLASIATSHRILERLDPPWGGRWFICGTIRGAGSMSIWIGRFTYVRPRHYHPVPDGDDGHGCEQTAGGANPVRGAKAVTLIMRSQRVRKSNPKYRGG